MALTKVPSNLDATVAITQSASDNSTNVATTAYVDTAISNLVDGAPGTLNTLDEIAAALNDDAALNTTLTTSIATKLPLAGGTLTGALTINSGTANTGLTITSTDAASWLTMTDPTASLFFGNTGGEFALWTGGSESMRVDGSGNVGIGTDNPSRRLSVERDTGITSGFNDIAEFLDTTLGVGGSVSLNIGKAASNKNLGKMAFKYAGNASNDNLLSFGFFDNDNLMNLTSTGKLVVGAAGPGNVGNGGLRLYSNIEETLAIDGSAGTQAIHFYDNTVRKGIIGFTNGTSIAPDASDHDMVIRAETGGAIHFAISATSKLNINSSGQVYSTSDINTQANSSGLEHRILQNNNGTTVLRRDGAISYLLSESGVAANRQLVLGYQSGAGGTISETMRLDENGNVGIGNTDPQVSLALGNGSGERMHVYHSGNVRAGFGVDMSGESRELSIFHSTSGTDGNINFGKRLESNGAYTQSMSLTGAGILKGMNYLELKNAGGTDGSATSPRLYSPASGNLAISANGSERLRVDTTGVIIKGHLGINRSITNGSIFFGIGGIDANHALWNGYNGDDPITRGASNSGFDGINWNTYRGLRIRGGTGGASNCLIIENSSSNNQDHTVKLFASGTERLATNTTGVAINGNITVSGTGDFTGKVDFQGTAAIEGGTSGSGYGVFKGYTANANHMLISRGKLSGTNTNPVITGGHEMTFVEYVGDDSSGFVFKSSHVLNSAYTEKVVFRSSHNTFQAAIRCIGTITASYSDERLKDVHGTIESALEKVQQLSGFYYTPNQTAQKLGYEKEKTVGLSAQAVQKVMPEVVKPAPVSFNEGVDEDYLTIQYEKLVPLLIESIKEQQTIIDDLKSRIEALEG